MNLPINDEVQEQLYEMNLPLDEIDLQLDEMNLPLNNMNLSNNMEKTKRDINDRLEMARMKFTNIRTKSDEEINQIYQNVIKIIKENDAYHQQLINSSSPILGDFRKDNIPKNKQGYETYQYYKDNGMLDKIVELKSQGLSHQKIADELNKLGYTRKKDKNLPITKSIIQNIIVKNYI
jgi:hypothetical protein